VRHHHEIGHRACKSDREENSQQLLLLRCQESVALSPAEDIDGPQQQHELRNQEPPPSKIVVSDHARPDKRARPACWSRPSPPLPGPAWKAERRWPGAGALVTRRQEEQAELEQVIQGNQRPFTRIRRT